MLSVRCFMLCRKVFGKGEVAHPLERLCKVSTIHFSTIPSLSKIYQNFHEAIEDIEDGAKLLIGGFDFRSLPQNLIEALYHHSVKNLTLVSNDAGVEPFSLRLLVQQKKIKRIITSYVGAEFEHQYLTGELELELIPLGTLAERVRAGGAGIPAFYTPTGFGTLVHEGGFPIKYDKEGKVTIASEPRLAQIFNGKKYILEEAITGDYALIKAWKADPHGNLLFDNSARNFNSIMARAAKTTIVEVEEIVDLGTIKPDKVQLPGMFVDRVIKRPKYNKRMEKLMVTNKNKSGGSNQKSAVWELKDRIIRRAALELKDGMCVYLGMGIPLRASSYIPNDKTVMVLTGNGILGLDSSPTFKSVRNFIGKDAVVTGASFFGSEDSFAMIRGGHLDLAMLGAMEVAQNGDLANWTIPKKIVKGMGGGMDLVAAPNTQIVVCMEHNAKDGRPKILEKCSLPLTGQRCVNLIITEKGVFKVIPDKGLMLIEIAEDLSLDELKKTTGCRFEVSSNLKPIAYV